MSQSVGFYIPTVAYSATGGKILHIVHALKRVGYDVVVLCWSDEVAKGCQEEKLAYMRMMTELVQPDRIAESKKCLALLGKKMVEKEGAPTWGDLLVMDDFIGMATGIKVDGASVFRFDCVIGPMGGMEEATIEDEHMRLVVWRWARANKIPHVGMEVQTLDMPYRMSIWPVDLLLTKSFLRKDQRESIAPVTFPMPPAYRYCLSIRRDANVEAFLKEEEGLRKMCGWKPGQYFVCVPFHIYYIRKMARAFEQIGKLAAQLKEAGIRVVVTVTKNFRRGEDEKNIVVKGLRRWIKELGNIDIVEGGPVLDMCLLAEAVVLAYPSSIRGVLEGMGVRVFGLDEVSKLGDLVLSVRPQEAVAWVIGQRKEG